MQGIQIAVYESYNDITGKQSTLDQARHYVSQYSCDSVLWVCSHVGVALRLFDAGDPDWDAYSKLIEQFFSAPLAMRFKAGFWARGAPVRFSPSTTPYALETSDPSIVPTLGKMLENRAMDSPSRS